MHVLPVKGDRLRRGRSQSDDQSGADKSGGRDGGHHACVVERIVVQLPVRRIRAGAYAPWGSYAAAALSIPGSPQS